MPYVDPEAAARLASGLTVPHMDNAGELNYVLTQVVVSYLHERAGDTFETVRYAMLNDIVGAMAGALAEFQRRVVAPYEQRRAAENGDVYPPGLRVDGRLRTSPLPGGRQSLPVAVNVNIAPGPGPRSGRLHPGPLRRARTPEADGLNISA